MDTDGRGVSSNGAAACGFAYNAALTTAVRRSLSDSPVNCPSLMPDTPLVDPRTAQPWIVLKFGGTSVSRRHRWDTIGRLAKKRSEEADARVLVVVSALSGVTNELQAIANLAANDGREIDGRIAMPIERSIERSIQTLIAALIERHRGFCAELDLDPDAVLGPRLDALRALGADPRAAAHALDWQADVLAQGELLSSTLGAAYLSRARYRLVRRPRLARCGVAAQRQRLGAAVVGELPVQKRRA
jgi:Amino acid kinase family